MPVILIILAIIAALSDVQAGRGFAGGCLLAVVFGVLAWAANRAEARR